MKKLFHCSAASLMNCLFDYEKEIPKKFKKTYQKRESPNPKGGFWLEKTRGFDKIQRCAVTE